MTTLAAREGILAADTRLTYYVRDDEHHYTTDGRGKIFPIRNVHIEHKGNMYHLKAIAMAGSVQLTGLIKAKLDEAAMSSENVRFSKLLYDAIPPQLERPSCEFLAVCHCGKIITSHWERRGVMFHLVIRIVRDDTLTVVGKNVEALRAIDSMTGGKLSPMDVIALNCTFDKFTGGHIEYVSGDNGCRIFKRIDDKTISLITNKLAETLKAKAPLTWDDLPKSKQKKDAASE